MLQKFSYSHWHSAFLHSQEFVAMLTIVDFLYHKKYKYFIKAAIVDSSLQLRISAKLWCGKPFKLPKQYKTSVFCALAARVLKLSLTIEKTSKPGECRNAGLSLECLWSLPSISIL